MVHTDSNTTRPGILIVDDDEHVTRSLARSLRDQFTVFTANSAAAALDIMAHDDIAVVLTDQRMPGLTGVELLEQIQTIRPDAVGIIISGYTDIVALVDAINLGTVRGYIPKPWDIAELRERLNNAVHTYHASFLNREVLHRSAEAVTRMHEDMAQLQQMLEQIAGGETTQVFLTGEAERETDWPDRPSMTDPERSMQQVDTDAPLSTRGLLSKSMPEVFQRFILHYGELLELALNQRVYKVDHRISEKLRAMSKQLGQLRAGPRDVVEIHSAALKDKLVDAYSLRKQALIEESHLLLVELMGYLTTYYRVNFLVLKKPSS